MRRRREQTLYDFRSPSNEISGTHMGRRDNQIVCNPQEHLEGRQFPMQTMPARTRQLGRFSIEIGEPRVIAWRSPDGGRTARSISPPTAAGPGRSARCCSRWEIKNRATRLGTHRRAANTGEWIDRDLDTTTTGFRHVHRTNSKKRTTVILRSGQMPGNLTSHSKTMSIPGNSTPSIPRATKNL